MEKTVKQMKCEINCWCWLAAFSFTISQGSLHPEKARVNKLMYRLRQTGMEIKLSVVKYCTLLNEPIQMVVIILIWMGTSILRIDTKLIFVAICSKLNRTISSLFTRVKSKQQCLQNLVNWANTFQIFDYCEVNLPYYFCLDQPNNILY